MVAAKIGIIYKVNKMLMETGISYEHGATNPKVM